MKSPICHREVQSLNGILAALSRFLVKSRDKSLPFSMYLGSKISSSGHLSLKRRSCVLIWNTTVDWVAFMRACLESGDLPQDEVDAK